MGRSLLPARFLFMNKIKMLNTMCKDLMRVSSLLSAASSSLFNDRPCIDPADMGHSFYVGRCYKHFGRAVFDSPTTSSLNLAGLSWSP